MLSVRVHEGGRPGSNRRRRGSQPRVLPSTPQPPRRGHHEAGTTGLEPATSRLTSECSAQLSYAPENGIDLCAGKRMMAGSHAANPARRIIVKSGRRSAVVVALVVGLMFTTTAAADLDISQINRYYGTGHKPSTANANPDPTGNTLRIGKRSIKGSPRARAHGRNGWACQTVRGVRSCSYYTNGRVTRICVQKVGGAQRCKNIRTTAMRSLVVRRFQPSQHRDGCLGTGTRRHHQAQPGRSAEHGLHKPCHCCGGAALAG